MACFEHFGIKVSGEADLAFNLIFKYSSKVAVERHRSSKLLICETDRSGSAKGLGS